MVETMSRLAEELAELLRAFGPQSARFGVSQWAHGWGVHVFDGGEQLGAGNGATLAEALADLEAQANGRKPRVTAGPILREPEAAPEAREPRRRSLDDLLG